MALIEFRPSEPEPEPDPVPIVNPRSVTVISATAAVLVWGALGQAPQAKQEPRPAVPVSATANPPLTGTKPSTGKPEPAKTKTAKVPSEARKAELRRQLAERKAERARQARATTQAFSQAAAVVAPRPGISYGPPGVSAKSLLDLQERNNARAREITRERSFATQLGIKLRQSR